MPWQNIRKRRSAQIRESKHTDCSGRHVACVGEWGLTPFLLTLVQRNEVGVGHVDLATHFQHRRHVGTKQTQRDFANRPHVVRDVVSDLPVAARDTPNQLALFVNQRNGHAVDLQFDHPLDWLVGNRFDHALAVLQQLLAIVGVVDRQHGKSMRDADQTGNGRVTDPLCRTVRRDPLGMGGLELLQFLHQAVVFEIADLRLPFHVVLVVMLADQTPQLVHACLGVLTHDHDPHSGVTGTLGSKAVLGTRQRNLSGTLPVLRNWCTSSGRT